MGHLIQREIPSRRILPRFQIYPTAGNSLSRTVAAFKPSFIGFPTSSMEGAIVRWLSSVGYRSSAIVRWPSVTTGDSTSANPPSLPDSAINGLLPTAPYVPSLIQFQSWLPSWKGETPCIFFSTYMTSIQQCAIEWQLRGGKHHWSFDQRWRHHYLHHLFLCHYAWCMAFVCLSDVMTFLTTLIKNRNVYGVATISSLQPCFRSRSILLSDTRIFESINF